MCSKSPIPLWMNYDRPLPNREAILSQPMARDSFDRVTKLDPRTGKQRFDGEELVNRLRVITLLSRHDMRVLDKKGDWASGTGKTRRTIRRFPDRIREIADEIELLNGMGKTRRTIRRLPGRIRKIADEIELLNGSSGVFPVSLAS